MKKSVLYIALMALVATGCQLHYKRFFRTATCMDRSQLAALKADLRHHKLTGKFPMSSLTFDFVHKDPFTCNALLHAKLENRIFHLFVPVLISDDAYLINYPKSSSYTLADSLELRAQVSEFMAAANYVDSTEAAALFFKGADYVTRWKHINVHF